MRWETARGFPSEGVRFRDTLGLMQKARPKLPGRTGWRQVLGAIVLATLVGCDARPPVDPEPESQPESEVAAKIVPDGVRELQGTVSFTLDDGEVRHRENPDTFWIPPKAERETLVEGDLVKLVFNLTDGEQTQGERMWVLVTGKTASGYTGTIDNDPYSTDRIKAGHAVAFEPRHVIDIYEDEDEDPSEEKDP